MKSKIEELYDELGKLRWLGADEGWDRAIEAVRKRIVEMVREDMTEKMPKKTNALTKVPCQKCGNDAWIKPGVHFGILCKVCANEATNFTVTARKEQYTSDEPPCLHETANPLETSWLACGCPKCSPRC